MKNKTFLDSIRCAVVGLIEAIRSEKNYKYYIIIALIGIATALLIRSPMEYYIGLIVTAAGAFSSECMNTAMEKLIDLIDKEIKEEIRIIKDISAASVLCFGVGYFTILGIMVVSFVCG